MSITISVDDAQVQATLRRLQQRVSNLRPALAAVANELQSVTDHAFQTETDPATGRRWQDLADSTKKSRTKVGKWPGQILQMSAGGLVASIQPQSSDTFAEVGTNKVYAAIHQFGGRAGRNHASIIPARPFLGLGADDKAEIIAILERHIVAE